MGDSQIGFVFFHKGRQTVVLSELTHPLPKDVTQKKIDVKIKNLEKRPDHP